MNNDWSVGDLIYRLDSLCIEPCLYFIITDIDFELIYVNPPNDLTSNYFVHDIKDMHKMYRKANITEQVLYGRK